MAKLLLPGSGGKSVECHLQGPTSIGRNADNVLQVLEEGVSKHHCLIVKNGEEYLIRDLNSTNGTFLNGKKVTEDTPLKDGDEISIAGVKAFFHLVERQPVIQETLLKAHGISGKAFFQKFGNDRQGKELSVVVSQTDVASRVHEKVAMESARFLPVDKILDEAVLRRDYEKLRIAHELLCAVGGEVDQDVILEKILESCFNLLPADQGVFLIYDEREVLAPRAVRWRNRDTTEPVSISTSMVKMVEQEKIGLLCFDAMRDPRFSLAQSVIASGIRSSMAVPLLCENHLMGILFLDSLVATNAFSSKDLQLFSAIANQAALLMAHAVLARKHREEAVANARFQRMFSPAVARLVAQGGEEIRKGGEIVRATVLFADIRGFTSYSEKISPDEAVEFLNRYFEWVVDVIFQFDGTLDKFVGDEVMAVFGAPFTRPDDSKRAVRAALAIAENLKSFNAERLARGFSEISIGIGINTGPMVAGYIGSSKALQYTVIGSSVNLASRLCSNARDGHTIVISETTWTEIKDHFETKELEAVPLKGISEPVRTFQVLRESSPARGDLTEERVS